MNKRHCIIKFKHVKACSNGPNNVGPTSCNNFQIAFCTASFANTLTHQVSTGINLIGLSKTFEKQAVEPSVSSLLNNVGPTLLGPFEQALRLFDCFILRETFNVTAGNQMLMCICDIFGGNFLANW